MHTNVSSPQAHGAPGFLPWHRAYLLDLERELQAIDPSVALPYWRFDQAAPNLFTARLPRRVRFARHRAVQQQQPAAVLADRRRAGDQPPAVLQHRDRRRRACCHEAQTLGARHPVPRRSGPWKATRTDRRTPASAVRSRASATAARDPLFFLLHCNVDRLWAKWQRQNGRFNPAQAASYDSSARIRSATICPTRCGRGTASPARSASADGARRRAGGVTGVPRAPGPQPRVRSTLDYQGAVSAASRMGFDYDDVPFVTRLHEEARDHGHET